jgi:hypothetical protein
MTRAREADQGIALFRGLQRPLHRLGVVLLHTIAKDVEHPEG